MNHADKKKLVGSMAIPFRKSKYLYGAGLTAMHQRFENETLLGTYGILKENG